MDKDPDAFRTISEVADELDVPQHVLRFWESRFRELKPMKRGGGRRYYRPEDVDLLRGIRHLLYGEGYTIRGVQRILREQGLGFVQAIWQAGAARPAPEPAEEIDEQPGTPARLPLPDPAPAAAHPRPVTQAVGPTAERPEGDEPAPARPSGGAPASDGLHRLQAVLAELRECRRLLDAALGPSS